MSRRGMTLTEMMVALTIIGILINLALPSLAELKRRGDAARVIGDYRTVRTAVFDRYATLGNFPGTGSWGAVPTALRGFLPSGFRFRYRSVDYRWRRFSLPNGLPRSPGQTVLLGLDIRTNDVQLMRAIKSTYRGNLAFGTSTQVTFVIE